MSVPLYNECGFLNVFPNDVDCATFNELNDTQKNELLSYCGLPILGWFKRNANPAEIEAKTAACTSDTTGMIEIVADTNDANSNTANTNNGSLSDSDGNCILNTSFSNQGECQAVRKCVQGQYEHQAPSLSTDRICRNHSAQCSSTQYEIQPATDTQDRLCAPLTTCSENQFESQSPTSTQDRICQNIAQECTNNQYESQSPGLRQNRICSPITECASNQFESQAPTQTTDRICTNLRVCNDVNANPTNPTEYEISPPTDTSNRQCANLTTCDDVVRNPTNPTQFESVPPTAYTNRQCATLSPPCNDVTHPNNIGNTNRATEYESPAPGVSNDRSCLPLAICDWNQTNINLSTQYESAAPTKNTNRICSPLTVCQNDMADPSDTNPFATEYESRAPEYNADRQCSPLTICNTTDVNTVTPTQLPNPLPTQMVHRTRTATTDRECSTLTICPSSEYESSSPTHTTDRQCTPITDCERCNPTFPDCTDCAYEIRPADSSANPPISRGDAVRLCERENSVTCDFDSNEMIQNLKQMYVQDATCTRKRIASHLNMQWTRNENDVCVIGCGTGSHYFRGSCRVLGQDDCSDYVTEASYIKERPRNSNTEWNYPFVNWTIVGERRDLNECDNSSPENTVDINGFCRHNDWSVNQNTTENNNRRTMSCEATAVASPNELKRKTKFETIPAYFSNVDFAENMLHRTANNCSSTGRTPSNFSECVPTTHFTSTPGSKWEYVGTTKPTNTTLLTGGVDPIVNNLPRSGSNIHEFQFCELVNTNKLGPDFVHYCQGTPQLSGFIDSDATNLPIFRDENNNFVDIKDLNSSYVIQTSNGEYYKHVKTVEEGMKDMINTNLTQNDISLPPFKIAEPAIPYQSCNHVNEVDCANFARAYNINYTGTQAGDDQQKEKGCLMRSMGYRYQPYIEFINRSDNDPNRSLDHINECTNQDDVSCVCRI